jgi:hypothetical protein
MLGYRMRNHLSNQRINGLARPLGGDKLRLYAAYADRHPLPSKRKGGVQVAVAAPLHMPITHGEHMANTPPAVEVKLEPPTVKESASTTYRYRDRDACRYMRALWRLARAGSGRAAAFREKE